MLTLSPITGGTVEFIEGRIAPEQQGCKAIYRLGERTYFILLNDRIVAIDDSKHVGNPIEAILPGTKGKIVKRQDDAEGAPYYVLLLEKLMA